MSEDDQPVFPRSNGQSNEEKQKLFQETRKKLEDEEKTIDRALTGIYCSNCQTENNADAKFCRGCGRELAVPEIPPPVFSPLKTQEENFPPVEFPPKTEELPKFVTSKEVSPDDIHTTMYGPAPMRLAEEKFDPLPIPMYGPPPVLETDRDLPKTEPVIKIEKENPLLTGLNYEEWRGRVPWLIIGGIIGFLIAAVIILTIVLLVVAIR